MMRIHQDLMTKLEEKIGRLPTEATQTPATIAQLRERYGEHALQGIALIVGDPARFEAVEEQLVASGAEIQGLFPEFSTIIAIVPASLVGELQISYVDEIFDGEKEFGALTVCNPTKDIHS